MCSLDTLTEFFGRCSTVNIGLPILASIAVALVTGPISKIHAKLL